MNISQYIIIKKRNKWSYGSRMTKESPSLASNEIAVKVSLELPDEIFDKPTFQAQIKVPKEAVSRPIIDAEVIDNVESIIKQNTGFEVKLEIVEKDKESKK